MILMWYCSPSSFLHTPACSPEGTLFSNTTFALLPSRFGAVAGNGYGLGYSIDQDHITIPTTAFRAGGHTDGELMAAGVVQALREIGDACR